MAWRPYDQLIEGVLDNTVPGKVTGWMNFIGKEETVTFDLNGDFHRDIRGASVLIHGDNSAEPDEAKKYMKGFGTVQQGNVGDMTAGREPVDYVEYGYFEWFSEANGRVVIEVEPEQVELLSQPIPAVESFPVDREEKAKLMFNFMTDLAKSFGEDNKNESIKSIDE